ncbi:MAG: hypothetical protein NVS3B20_23050 [Polyangiales bacterium]
MALIEQGVLNEGSLDELGVALGVTSRHLHRAMRTQLGVSPLEFAQSRRVSLAKQLLRDTSLGVATIAFASGFRSVRRFNTSIRERLGRTPSELRGRSRVHDGEGGTSHVDSGSASISIPLEHRTPYDFAALLAFLRPRATKGVECVDGERYLRTLRAGDRTGWVIVSKDARGKALRAEISLSLVDELMTVVSALRRVLDLDAHPCAINARLSQDVRLAPMVSRRPGLRLPGALDGFELAARAILGQQVSVAAATTLFTRLVRLIGSPLKTPHAALTHLTPRPQDLLAHSNEASLCALGILPTRARSLIALATAMSEGRLKLSPPDDIAHVTEALLSIPGIGRWTAEYVVMRALSEPDAFPVGDLGLRQARGALSPRDQQRAAESFRPFRAYAAMHLWTSLSEEQEPT